MFVFSVTIYAQNTGRIVGHIKEKDTGDDVIGANVILEGTHLGAASDIEGNYSINNVPPGEYNLIVSMISYQKVTIKNIVVKNNITAKQDVTLSSATIELGQEIVVTADKPLIQKDLTSSSTTVTSAELKAMPVENISQVINLQAGVVGGHFRGGRSNEVAYLVDGVAVTDAYNNSLGIEIENNVIRQMEVISGTFNAEYGQAMSGVVNIITKNGSPKYEGSVSAYTGNYYSSSTEIFRNLDKPFALQSYDVQGSFSGPVPLLNDLTFFSNLRYFKDDGYLYGQKVFDINQNSNLQSIDDFINLIQYGKTPSGTEWVSMNPYNKISFQGKLNYSQPTYSLSYSLFLDDQNNQDYAHNRLFAPDGRKTHYRFNTVQSLQFTYIPNSNTFHTLKASLNSNDAKGYLYSDEYDSRYIQPGVEDNGGAAFPFKTGGNEVDRYKRYTKTGIFQWSMTSQLNNKHKLGIGAEAKVYELFASGKSLIYNTSDSTLIYAPEHAGGNQSYLKRPYEGSFYIQDKMEYDIMIINAGIRFEAFNPNTQTIADKRNPLDDPNQPGAFQRKSADVTYQISPRIGFSFPITDQGAIHFSYGHFLQIPSFDYLYTNDERVIDAGSLNSVTGNPNLKPQKTVMYELGLQQVFLDQVSADLTIYYRDIRNLLGTEIVNTYTSYDYARYVNRDYGNVKGLIFSIDKALTDFWGFKIDYTFQIAEGNASDPLASFQNAKDKKEPEKHVTSLDWDQRSTLNIATTIGKPGDWTVGVIYNYGSGYPYTEDPKQTQLVSFINGGVKPSTNNVDLRAEMAFEISGIRFNTFGLVYNLFNVKNEYGVSASSGRANSDFDLQEQVKKGQISQQMADIQLNDPTKYSRPRNIKLGISFNF